MIARQVERAIAGTHPLTLRGRADATPPITPTAPTRDGWRPGWAAVRRPCRHAQRRARSRAENDYYPANSCGAPPFSEILKTALPRCFSCWKTRALGTSVIPTCRYHFFITGIVLYAASAFTSRCCVHKIITFMRFHPLNAINNLPQKPIYM